MATSSKSTKSAAKSTSTDNAGRRNYELIKPMFHTTQYDFSAGTKLLITLLNGTVIEGKAMTNPKATRVPSMIELIDVKNITADRLISDALLLHDHEIESVKILEKVSLAQRTRTEFNLPTFLVDSEEKLTNLISTINESPTKEIGVAFHGVNIGRFGQVIWIIISCGKCIAPIDVVEFEPKNLSVWKLLMDTIFQNETILKVFHNVRPAADYLFHRHSIVIKNVYDTQLMDHVLCRKSKQVLKDGMLPPTKMIPLYAALKKYLEHLAPDTDIVYLKWYFNYPKFSKTTDNPLLVRPTPTHKYTKYMALSAKYLLHLKKEIEWMRNKNFRELFKSYMDQAIDADLNSADDEELMEELPQMLDLCFPTNQNQTNNNIKVEVALEE